MIEDLLNVDNWQEFIPKDQKAEAQFLYGARYTEKTKQFMRVSTQIPFHLTFCPK